MLDGWFKDTLDIIINGFLASGITQSTDGGSPYLHGVKSDSSEELDSELGTSDESKFSELELDTVDESDFDADWQPKSLDIDTC